MDNLPPILTDPTGAARCVAMTIMECEPPSRCRALRRLYGMYYAIGVTLGCTDDEAAAWATEMQRRVGDAVRALEVS